MNKPDLKIAKLALTAIAIGTLLLAITLAEALVWAIQTAIALLNDWCDRQSSLMLNPTAIAGLLRPDVPQTVFSEIYGVPPAVSIPEYASNMAKAISKLSFAARMAISTGIVPRHFTGTHLNLLSEADVKNLRSKPSQVLNSDRL
jgi:hypothetical protein